MNKLKDVECEKLYEYCTCTTLMLRQRFWRFARKWGICEGGNTPLTTVSVFLNTSVSCLLSTCNIKEFEILRFSFKMFFVVLL
jgi:hypothetical protein